MKTLYIVQSNAFVTQSTVILHINCQEKKGVTANDIV